MNLTDLLNEYRLYKSDPKRYLLFCCGVSIVSCLVLVMIDFDLIFLVPLIFYVLYAYPKRQYFKKLGQIEKKLPMFLRLLAIQHKMKIPLNLIFDSLKQNFPEFLDFEELYLKYGSHSDYVSRAYFLLDSLYKTGTGEDEIISFSNEISDEMELKIKEYNKKLIAMSVVFVGIGAVLPGMLQVYYLIGTKFLDVELTQDQIFFLFVIGFPLINGVLLWSLNKKKPRFY